MVINTITMKAYHVFFISSMLVFTGCVITVNPIYTEEDLIFNEKLIGVWNTNESNGSEMWIFEKTNNPESKSYLLTHQKNNTAGTFAANLVKIGNQLFLDLYPLENTSKNDFANAHIQKMHSFSKVSLKGNKLELQMLSPKWFDTLVSEKKLSLKHYRTADGQIVITDSTEELQAFLTKYSSSADAFEKPRELYK
jgi:hypothetical protein